MKYVAVELFEYNKDAYEAALAMLSESGKAAVIHPTGTGKSFIGFKLCEENPDKTICWLSPSKYIYQTQIENLVETSNGYQPNNIKFYTYAKLINLSQEEISEIQPDYIILDEFHRCGAEQWGTGVEVVLKTYPNVPILGLSATSIRYLDNQRNMTDELFDGNIASEMTLGEAIVRGILNPPKYILSIFSYQKDLKAYEKRVHKARSKAVQDTAEAYLEALRRALDKAEKLDVMFDKHISDRAGKYIVFCSSFEHMQEMINNANEWFRKIDKEPHIYSMYSDDPTASKSFAGFKADNDKKHLKLLYCIDALNEGIHVPDVSGVILLRPTISPIIYKQQIGRALSASKTKNPVIFDIVNNIENLYNIDYIKEEMRNAIFYFRSYNNERLIVNENFEVIDKLEKCRELFEHLEGALTASWDIMYAVAEQYYIKNGNLDIPKRWISEDGYSLGLWLDVQRRVRTGKVNGILTDEQINRLDKIGMNWDTKKDISWNKYYHAALDYYHKNYSLDVKSRYVNEDGVRLGSWLAQLRISRRIGMNSSYLTPEHISMLDELGMIWDVYDFLFERNYHAAVEYYHHYGNLDCKVDYVNHEGIKLGAWLSNLRHHYKNKKCTIITEEQFALMNAIGMNWKTKYEQQWERKLSILKEYIARMGDVEVPSTACAEGIQIGRWLREQKRKFMNGKLNKDRVNKLQALGIDLKIDDSHDIWEKKFQIAKTYSETHGGILNVPSNLVIDGINLYTWLNKQKMLADDKHKKKLTVEQINKLVSIGMVFGESNIDRNWEIHYSAVKSYIERTGTTKIPSKLLDTDGVNLHIWLKRQLNYAHNGELSNEKAEKLRKIGVVLEQVDSFEVGFAHANKYYNEHGNLLVKNGYVCNDNFNLYIWINNIRSNKERLSNNQIEKLNSIGMIWNVMDYKWDEMFEEAKKFAVDGETLKIPRHQLTSSGKDLYDWYCRQRSLYYRGKLSCKRIEKLLSIGADLF